MTGQSPLREFGFLAARARSEKIAASAQISAPLRSGETMTLRSAGAQHGRLQLRLTDMLGRIRWEGNMEAGQRSLQLLLPPLPPGMYLLGVRSGARGAARPILVVR